MSERPSNRNLRRGGALMAGMVFLLGVGATTVSAAGPAPAVSRMQAKDAHHPTGHAKAAGSRSLPNLVYHSGQIMTDSVVQAIFWGSGWSDPGDKISGLDTLYKGLGGSGYMKTNNEYTGTNGQVGTKVTVDTYLVDLSTGPTKDPGTSGIQAEVAKMIANPVANGYYPVYIDAKRGSAGYCAWHSYGTVRNASGVNVPVQFAFFFNLDGDPGCDPGDPASVTHHSQGLAALANVSGHELSEAVTDPRNGGWWDRRGAENADKCAWTFSGRVTLGGEQWTIQGNWSNAANNAKSGYDGAGCIQTK
jgi:hypothetical protein